MSPLRSGLVRNTLFNLAGQLTPLVVGVAVIPVLLRELGATRFGILSIGWILAGNLGLFDFGVTRAVTKLIAEASGQERPMTTMTQMVGSALAIQSALGLIGSIGLAAFSTTLASDLLKIPEGMMSEVILTFRVLALTVPIFLLSLAFRAVLEGLSRFDILGFVKIPLSTGNFLLPLVGLRLGFDLVGITLLLLINQLLGLMAYRSLAIRCYPAAKVRPRLDRESLKNLMGYGGWVTVSQLVGPILIYADRFVLGALVSVAAVGVYAAPFEVMMRLAIIPASFAGAIFPVFASFGRSRRDDRLADLAGRSMKYVLLVMGSIAIFAAGYADPLLRMWLGTPGPDLRMVVIVLILGLVANAVAHIPYSLLQAMGRPDVTAKLHLVELPIHMSVLIAFVGLWGIIGAAAAWSLRSLLDLLLLVAAAHRLGFLRLPIYVSERIPLLIGALGAMGIAAFLVAHQWEGSEFSELLIIGLLLMVGLLAIHRWVLLERDRSLLVQLVERTL